MATINQIQKQIETANKRIADYAKRIAMYQQRTNKAIAALNNLGANVTIDSIIAKSEKMGNVTLWEYSLPREVKTTFPFDATYKVESNFMSMKENEGHMKKEHRHLAALEQELAALKKESERKESAHNGELAIALRNAMEEFKRAWFSKMMSWYGSHYDHIKEITPAKTARQKRAQRINNYIERLSWAAQRNHARIHKYIENVIRACVEITNSEVNHYADKESYLSAMHKRITEQWARGMEILIEKCTSFGLDEANLKARYPAMTQKGFEVVITDGKPRRIYARVIWAAECSPFVAPHTRYIVTEKRSK